MPTTSISTGSKASLKHNRRIKKKTKEELNSENYRRQMETLFEKIDRIVTFFGVDIFVNALREVNKNSTRPRYHGPLELKK